MEGAVPKKPFVQKGEQGIQAVARALAILDAFTAERTVLTLSELSALLGLNKATAYRLANALAARGMLWRDQRTRTYTLGPHILSLADLATRRRDLTSVCMPHMLRLAAETGETVGLHIRLGKARLCISQIESRHELSAKLDIGKPLPLYCGAGSKALIADMPEDEIDDLIAETGLKPLGPGSIVDPREFKRALKSVRTLGYATSCEERTQGGITIAAPIRDFMRLTVAALSIYAPLVRVDKALLKTWAPTLLSATRTISEELPAPARKDRLRNTPRRRRVHMGDFETATP
jgi:DNA-binding IclR family transcriptional regulator